MAEENAPFEVGWVHVGDAVTLLYGFPLRRIGADFTAAQAEEIMQNATLLSQAGQGIPVRAYHKRGRASSPLNALPRGEDGDGPIVGAVRAVGIDDGRGLLLCDAKIMDPRALRLVRTAPPGTWALSIEQVEIAGGFATHGPTGVKCTGTVLEGVAFVHSRRAGYPVAWRWAECAAG